MSLLVEFEEAVLAVSVRVGRSEDGAVVVFVVDSCNVVESGVLGVLAVFIRVLDELVVLLLLAFASWG